MDITGIEKLSQKSLESANQKEGIWWLIALGAALGPVFSSCNPTYTVLLAMILPESLTMWLMGLCAYFFGLGMVLLLIAYFGRSIIGRFAFFSNPRGLFRRILWGIILIVGLLIVTGYIKRVETYFIEKNLFVNTFSFDNQLNKIILKNHNNKNNMCSNGKCDEEKDGWVMMDVANAPELTGIAAWINSPPLTMESLRGKVVLVDFWTYSCINCIRTQPYLNTWYEKYEKDGLVIIGVHAPEFAFEKIENNVRESSQKSGIKYPIALDNDFQTWNAYANRYWPAKYLIDKDGNIVYKHFWEWNYEETEKKIQELLWK
jgi:thiol-disulfide isomerase/thioredoxin